jgi:hypothetical protein
MGTNSKINAIAEQLYKVCSSNYIPLTPEFQKLVTELKSESNADNVYTSLQLKLKEVKDTSRSSVMWSEDKLWNAKVVRIRGPRRCYSCGRELSAGSVSLTSTDMICKERVWRCPSCADSALSEYLDDDEAIIVEDEF